MCLDVWGRDSAGRVYDLEVQRAASGAQPRRARYLKRSERGVMEMCEIFEEIRQEGIEEGLTQGRINTLAELVRDGLLAASAAAERLGMTPEQFAAQASEQGWQLA